MISQSDIVLSFCNFWVFEKNIVTFWPSLFILPSFTSFKLYDELVTESTLSDSSPTFWLKFLQEEILNTWY